MCGNSSIKRTIRLQVFKVNVEFEQYLSLHHISLFCHIRIFYFLDAIAVRLYILIAC